MGLKDIIVPQDKVFFDLFEQQTAVLIEACDKLVETFNDYTDISEKYRQMKEIEHKGDTITHKTFDELNRTFITPFEPEEISRLASALDDVIDFIDDGTRLLVVYDVKECDEYMKQFAACLREAADVINKGIHALRNLKEAETIKAASIDLHRIENVGDQLLTASLQELFKSTDPIRIIKLKDVYEKYEIATDKCEDVANIFSAILIRHT
ncbi:MAG TPA: DUF47 family protein [Methanocorpusculum sp.]|nr:DUF47 family protein [Methanocorpusculum sp.]